MTLDELKTRLDRLSPVKLAFVARVVDSLSRPPRVTTSGETWLNASPDWIEYFGLALSVHHGATPEPFALTAFETVFDIIPDDFAGSRLRLPELRGWIENHSGKAATVVAPIGKSGPVTSLGKRQL